MKQTKSPTITTIAGLILMFALVKGESMVQRENTIDEREVLYEITLNISGMT